MNQKAISKIRTEIADKSTPQKKLIGEYIIEVILQDPANSEKILTEDKSLEKCWSSIEKQAKAKAVGGSAMISDREVFSWVNKYYGATVSNHIVAEWCRGLTDKMASEADPQTKAEADDLNVSLLDLL